MDSSMQSFLADRKINLSEVGRQVSTETKAQKIQRQRQLAMDKMVSG